MPANVASPAGNPFSDYMGVSMAWPARLQLEDMEHVRVSDTKEFPSLPRRTPTWIEGYLPSFFSSIRLFSLFLVLLLLF